MENRIGLEIENYKQKVRNSLESTCGITLITLVITIIILLILAGVVINISLGNNGIFKQAKEARETYLEQNAREKLEIVLLELQSDKEINGEYDEIEDVNKKITQNDMIIIDDIVSVDEWQFQIDRSVPKIISSLGKGTIEKQIEINMSQQVRSDYVNATINVIIEYEKNITSILLNGNNIEIPKREQTEEGKKGKYTLEIEVETNGIYTVIVTGENDKYNLANIKVTDITEDMDIYNVEDMVNFRNKVNMGRTFEGRTVRLMNDISLETVCGEDIGSFEPIYGYFYGNFDGLYNKITNIYINSNIYSRIGLFTRNDGQIENLILEEVNIYNYHSEGKIKSTGAICGINVGNIENCGVNSGYIRYKGAHNSECYVETGGIVGTNNNLISNCYNSATINAEDTNNSNIRVFTGGIAGSSNTSNSKIINSYNKGKIVNNCGSSASAVGGIVARAANNAIIENSYNYGIINKTGSSFAGGICGRINSGSILGKIVNSYCINNTPYSYHSGGTEGHTTGRVTVGTLQGYASKLGEAFVNDEKIKIINEENGEEQEVWKYNNGYPVLKWQVKQ